MVTVQFELAHGNADNKGDGVHVFLSGEHRPYRRDRLDDFAGRLPIVRLSEVISMKSASHFRKLGDQIPLCPSRTDASVFATRNG